MHQTRIIAVVSFIGISALWGQPPVFLISHSLPGPQAPQPSLQGVAASVGPQALRSLLGAPTLSEILPVTQLAVNAALATQPNMVGGKTSPRPTELHLAVFLSNRRILDQNNRNELLKTSSTLELALTKTVLPRMSFHLNTHRRKPRGLSWFTSIPCLSLSFSAFLSLLT